MELLRPGIGLFFWMALIFLLTLVILKKFAWKPILKMLDKREKGIADSIESAERVKAEMAQMKYEHEEVLKEAKTERSRILKEAKETKDKIVNEAKEEAKTEASKIVENARLSINNEKAAALNEVKNQAGILAVDVAEKILERELSDKNKQEDYIQKLLSDVELN